MQLQTAAHHRSPGKLALPAECPDGGRAPDHRANLAGFMDRACGDPLHSRTSGIVPWRLAPERALGPRLGGGSKRIGVACIARGDGADARRTPRYPGTRHAAFGIPAGGAATVEIDATRSMHG